MLIIVFFVQAYDLGLNCDSAKWKVHDHELFSAEETQTRRQIWWGSVLCDRYGSVYMGQFLSFGGVITLLTTNYSTLGRPVMIKDEDFETALPNVDPVGVIFDGCLQISNSVVPHTG